MRIGFARIVQRSNSFARDTTSIDDFRIACSEDLTDLASRYSDTDSILGGLLHGVEETATEILPILSTDAPAGGAITGEAVEEISELFVRETEKYRSNLAGIILELSGMMTTSHGRSGDEAIIVEWRKAFPDLPLAVIVAPQANVTPTIADHATLFVSTEMVPNTNAAETGKRALAGISQTISGAIKPAIHYESLPLLIPVAAQRLTQEPFSNIATSLHEARQREGLLNISILGGYPYADAPHAGASVVVTSAGNSGAEVATQFRDQLWDSRHQLFVEASNVEEAVHHAMASKAGPVLIADLGDNPDDGAPGDGTTVLWALLDLGVRSATIGSIADEQAVDACFRAGVDARVEIPVGGRKDTRHGYPIDIRAKVKSIHEGTFRLQGPINRGLEVDAGRVIVLDVEARHDGHVELILTEKPIQIIDASLFDHIGVNLAEREIVSIKSTIDYLPAFESIATAIFEVITPGITTPDPAFFDYQRVQRPIFPLDPVD